jgi:hypothetical protein
VQLSPLNILINISIFSWFSPFLSINYIKYRRQAKKKAHELAKVINYQDIEIGIVIGILRQRNLIPARS